MVITGERPNGKGQLPARPNLNPCPSEAWIMAGRELTTFPRRRLLAGSAAAAGITAGASASAKRRDVDCDRELIAACDRFIEAWEAYSDRGGQLDYEVCPLWQRLNHERNAVLALPATTIAGVVAKARAARAMAEQPEGLDYSDGFTGPLPGLIIEDLLRIAPGGIA